MQYNSIINKIFLACILFFKGFPVHAQDKVPVHSLTVNVNGLRNSNGVMVFALYNEPGSIPDEHYKKYYKKIEGEIIMGKAMATFKDLPPGTYAVNILHDENRNGKIEKGFMLPKEGIGFSNFTSIGLRNKPNFRKASFTLNQDRTMEIKLIYF